jgi:lysophospholipase L1-like esterase
VQQAAHRNDGMEAALTWATLLVGTPYGWWTGGPIPNGAPAWAADGPPPPLGAIKGTSCFCAGIPNLMLRHAGLPVPCEAHNEYCGGTGAYGLNFSAVSQKFDMEAADSYPRGTLLGMKYHSVARQGHVVVMLGPGKTAKLLQSTANSGPDGSDPTHPGVHANVTLEDCFRTAEYCKFEYAVLPQHWIDRRLPPARSCQDKMFGECGAGIDPGFNVTCCPGAHCKAAQKGAPTVCVPGEPTQQFLTLTLTPPPPPPAIRVACVGDSITAGYLSSNASFAYPGRLQAHLDAKFGPGIYAVTNFGAGGATVQKDADSPYWNRTQYATFVNGSSYDIVILMLGTNDAKDTGNGGAPNWPAACSLPNPSAASCTVVKDYLALVDVARKLGPRLGTPPQIAIMVPPPLWRDSAYGMNQTILNDIMPPLVPHLAKLAKLPPPIDLFTALGAADQLTSQPAS